MAEGRQNIRSNTGPLTAASFFSIVILFVGYSQLRDHNINQATFTWALCLSILLGLFSIAGYLELVAKSIWGFESFRWGFAACIALFSYLSRIDAANDINMLFHVDASALPLSTIAGTAMRFAAWMRWPMVFVFIASLIAIGLMVFGSLLQEKDDVEKFAVGIRIFAATIASGLAWLFIHAQLSDDGIRLKLYRIAHTADFVDKFNCKGYDSNKFDGLFIGPEQRRVLIAPKIAQVNQLFNADQQPPELMQTVDVPQYFPIVECERIP